MMLNDWNDYEEVFDESSQVYANQKNAKSRKRKWREIETVKEKQRLRRELLEFYEYS